MANYAEVKYIIKGAANEIAEIEAAVKSGTTLSNLCEELGCGKDFLKHNLNGVVRGYTHESNECLSIHCYCVWDKRNWFKELLQEHYPNCKVYWECLVLGDCKYATNSKDEIENKYIVVSKLSDHCFNHRFTTFEDACSEVYQALDGYNVEHPLFSTTEEMRVFLESYNKKMREDKECDKEIDFIEIEEVDE